ncbi:MAG: indole-3-glycerol phosphate synthase TrpC [Bacteroidaceae bacterium]|nr:indole-3-glycerol phosphate synthase TrpC [Bacteroidaceae bacterium]
MKDILEEIVANKRIELERQKQIVSLEKLRQATENIILAEEKHRTHTIRQSMRLALENSTSGIIAEFKRKSPSKGWIKESGRPEDIPLQYEQNGASALSILTDKKYFGGELGFIHKARKSVTLPVLRKDFIIDEYQLYEARAVGASAVLLIAADLTKDECKALTARAHELELEVLLEIHSEEELDYIQPDTDMVGVNNRNLGTFVTDVQNSFRLAEKLPKEITRVSESGISSPETISSLREIGFRGFLIGECFMKQESPGEALREFINKIR